MRETSQMRIWSPEKVILLSEDLNPRFLLNTFCSLYQPVAVAPKKQRYIQDPRRQVSHLLQGVSIAAERLRKPVHPFAPCSFHGKSVLICIPH